VFCNASMSTLLRDSMSLGQDLEEECMGIESKDDILVQTASYLSSVQLWNVWHWYCWKSRLEKQTGLIIQGLATKDRTNERNILWLNRLAYGFWTQGWQVITDEHRGHDADWSFLKNSRPCLPPSLHRLPKGLSTLINLKFPRLESMSVRINHRSIKQS
jgi:hypothetical protein